MAEATELVASDVLRVRCERFLTEVQSIRRDHAIAGVLAVGHAALRELYAGRWEDALRRGRAQDAPLRLLADHFGDELDWHGLSVDRIRNALRAAYVDRQLSPRARGELLPTVLRALGGIPDPGVLAQMADAAVTERWTAEQAQQAVTAWRKASLKGTTGGRPPLPIPIRHTRAAARAVAALAALEVDGLEEPERAATEVELQALAEAVAVALQRLRKR